MRSEIYTIWSLSFSKCDKVFLQRSLARRKVHNIINALIQCITSYYTSCRIHFLKYKIFVSMLKCENKNDEKFEVLDVAEFLQLISILTRFSKNVECSLRSMNHIFISPELIPRNTSIQIIAFNSYTLNKFTCYANAFAKVMFD